MMIELSCDFEVNPKIGIYFFRLMLMSKMKRLLYLNFYIFLQHARLFITIQSTNLKVRNGSHKKGAMSHLMVN